jgi:hypothetical protein
MSESLIDTLEGEGNVYSGATSVAAVSYKVRVYQQFVESRTLQGISRVPTLMRIGLGLSVTSGSLPMSMDLYTLHMEDGKRLNFYMTTPSVATATGGFF